MFLSVSFTLVTPRIGSRATHQKAHVRAALSKAAALERAIISVVGTKMKSMSAGKMGYSTSQVGDLVAKG